MGCWWGDAPGMGECLGKWTALGERSGTSAGL